MAQAGADPSGFETLLYEVREGLAAITLNRPQRRNALNRRAYAELEAAFRAAHADPAARCVIVTGADPAFCSGEDVKEMMTAEQRAAPAAEEAAAARPTPAAMAVLECDKPVIAAVNGPAVGWGMELALLADIRLASTRASFAELFIRRGLICDVGGLTRLPAIVGPAKAAELLFTGEAIDAHEAARIGLVSGVFPHQTLIGEARTLAGRIAAGPLLALIAMKQGLRLARHGRDAEIGTWAIGAIHRLFATEDHREGVKSFLEKRAPVFVGR